MSILLPVSPKSLKINHLKKNPSHLSQVLSSYLYNIDVNLDFS